MVASDLSVNLRDGTTERAVSPGAAATGSAVDGRSGGTYQSSRSNVVHSQSAGVRVRSGQASPHSTPLQMCQIVAAAAGFFFINRKCSLWSYSIHFICVFYGSPSLALGSAVLHKDIML